MNLFSSMRLNQVHVIPAAMMIRIWLLTAIELGLTPVAAWLAITFGGINAESHTGLFVLNVALIILIGLWVFFQRDSFSTFLASLLGVFLVALVGTALSAFCSVTAIATVFGIVGAMFAFNAMLSLLLGWNPGSRWLILLMVASGIIFTVMVNSLLGSGLSVWIMSILAVLVWAAAAFYKLDALSELPRKLYAEEFSTLPRCMALGGLMIYLSALELFFQVLMFLIEIVAGMLGW